MPKRVDQEARRRRITDAVARIVERDGSAAVTIRRVAAEAGVSQGQIQHYFPGKDDLLDAAVSTAGADLDETTRQAAALAADLGDHAGHRHRLAVELVALLPLDASHRARERRHRALVAVAPATTGGRPGDLAGRVAEIVGARLAAAADAGEVRPDVDIDDARLHLVATVAGLTDLLLAEVVTPAEATTIVEQVLARTLADAPAGGPGRAGARRAVNDPHPDTALRILRVAERHFAERGIEGASLREITREAGQGNRAAINYYFGDRRGLVRAVIARHRRDEEAHRNALLDDRQRAGRTDRRALAEALVLPLAAKLDDPDGGRHYLRVAADYYLHVSREDNARQPIPDSSIVRWHRLLGPPVGGATAADPGRALLPRRLAIRLTLLELALLAAEAAAGDADDAIAFLVTVVAEVLGTPVPSIGHRVGSRPTAGDDA
jgi:AcrR family transcriptional regulator